MFTRSRVPQMKMAQREHQLAGGFGVLDRDGQPRQALRIHLLNPDFILFLD